MSKLLKKEMKLTASVLSYLFILFGLMFMLPGYPVLCGAFFVSLGIFQSFQSAREANDIVYSALLPVSGDDIVKGKYLFVCFIELCGLCVMALCAALRMTVFSDVPAYRNNALMNANLFALAMAFVIFGLFNLIFVYGFFKTAYKFAGPFVKFIIAAFLTIGISEAAHYFPGLKMLNAFGTDALPLQLTLLLAGILIYILLTVFSCRIACRAFRRIDL